MADLPADPVALNYRGSPTFGANASVDTTGAQMVAANPNRKHGVWIRCTHGSVSALVGDATGTAVVTLQASAAAPFTFIPGTGAIFIKAASATTSVAWIEY